MHLDFFFFGVIILFLKYLILSLGAISGFDLAFISESSVHCSRRGGGRLSCASLQLFQVARGCREPRADGRPRKPVPLGLHILARAQTPQGFPSPKADTWGRNWTRWWGVPRIGAVTQLLSTAPETSSSEPAHRWASVLFIPVKCTQIREICTWSP